MFYKILEGVCDGFDVVDAKNTHISIDVQCVLSLNFDHTSL